MVKANAELRVIGCVGVPGVEDGVAVRYDRTLVAITQQGTMTQELRRSQAYRERAEALSHTGSFGLEVIEPRIGLLGRDFSNS